MSACPKGILTAKIKTTEIQQSMLEGERGLKEKMRRKKGERGREGRGGQKRKREKERSRRQRERE